jgi:hypothetical protein
MPGHETRANWQGPSSDTVVKGGPEATRDAVFAMTLVLGNKQIRGVGPRLSEVALAARHIRFEERAVHLLICPHPLCECDRAASGGAYRDWPHLR